MKKMIADFIYKNFGSGWNKDPELSNACRINFDDTSDEIVALIRKTISMEANRLEKVYLEENEIHEDYYIRAVRRFEKVLNEILVRGLS